MRRSRKALALALIGLFILSVFALPVDTNAFSGGLMQGNEDLQGNPVIIVQRGCFCHGEGSATDVTLAVSFPDQGNVTLSVSDVPAKYTGDQTYLLTVTIVSQNPPPAPTGAQGGFLMNASAGTLAAQTGDTSVQINSFGEATHTSQGNVQREWHVEWTAPPDSSGNVLFQVAGNAVDGDGVNSPGDHWNTLVFTVLDSNAHAPEGALRTYTVGPAAAETPAEEEEELGIFLRAYWIGLLGIGAMLLVIGVGYYVVKSQTRFHTDEREHKRRGLP